MVGGWVVGWVGCTKIIASALVLFEFGNWRLDQDQELDNIIVNKIIGIENISYCNIFWIYMTTLIQISFQTWL